MEGICLGEVCRGFCCDCFAGAPLEELMCLYCMLCWSAFLQLGRLRWMWWISAPFAVWGASCCSGSASVLDGEMRWLLRLVAADAVMLLVLLD